MKKLELKNWKLRGYFNCDPFFARSRETNAMTRGVTFDMDVTTPHDIYADLEKNGYIEDPYFGLNSMKCEWVASRWWLYYTEIELDVLFEHMEIVLEGVDGNAHVLVNNTEIGYLDNSFITFTFDAAPYLQVGKNEIRIIVENAPNEYGQIGYGERYTTQKPKFNYKWDFCTRLISLGVNKPVYLKLYDTARIENVWFNTEDKTDGTARVFVETKGCAEGCVIEAEFGGRVFTAPVEGGYVDVEMEQPEVWYPNGYGAQPLYPLTVKLTKNGALLDCEKTEVAFRKIEFVQNENADPRSYPFTYVVNGKKVYIKGVDITPLMQTNYAPDERYEELIDLLKNAHVNFIRVWGGGVIESQLFYTLCDRAGILVMQDMPQSSTGLALGTTKTPEFVEKISRTAEFAARTLRNHPSLASWTGGNELMHPDHKPLDETDPQLAILKALLHEHAPHVFFYPTTGLGPISTLNPNRPGENFDVHGPWNYSPHFYDLYNRSDSYFHSEFGMDGMMCYENLRKFLPEKDLVCTNVIENLTWRHHGEWWDHAWRDELLFGAPPKDLEEMCERSQRIQAECLRYAVEANRRRAFQNSGSVIWQANECYPNFAATTLIDFYMTPKKAYYAVAKAFSPLNVSLKYDGYRLDKGTDFGAEVFVIWDHEPLETEVVVRGEANGKIVFEKAYTCTPEGGYAQSLGALNCTVPDCSELKVTLFAKNSAAEYDNEIDFLVF